jgi:hypothetical protein
MANRFAPRLVYTPAEEAARCEMILLLAQHPGPCSKRLLLEKGDATWVTTLAEPKRRIAEKQRLAAST